MRVMLELGDRVHVVLKRVALSFRACLKVSTMNS